MKLKLTFPLLFILLFSLSTIGQNKIEIVKLDDVRLTKVLNNSKLIAENRQDYLSVRIYKMDNGSGSAGFENSEVSHNLLIAVSEFDENPEQSLFEIGPFINPKFVDWTDIKKQERDFTFEHGTLEKRKLIKLRVNISDLKLLKKSQ
jgi:hypothetical protein